MARYIEAARNRGFCAGRAIVSGNAPSAEHRAIALRYAKRVAVASGEVKEKKWSKTQERAALAAYDSARRQWQYDR